MDAAVGRSRREEPTPDIVPIKTGKIVLRTDLVPKLILLRLAGLSAYSVFSRLREEEEDVEELEEFESLRESDSDDESRLFSWLKPSESLGTITGSISLRGV